VIAEMAKEIVVMYMGKQVEGQNTVETSTIPSSYTRALLQSIPKSAKDQRAAGLDRRHGARSL